MNKYLTKIAVSAQENSRRLDALDKAIKALASTDPNYTDNPSFKKSNTEYTEAKERIKREVKEEIKSKNEPSRVRPHRPIPGTISPKKFPLGNKALIGAGVLGGGLAVYGGYKHFHEKEKRE